MLEKVEKAIFKALQVMEIIISIVTFIALVAALVIEVYQMITVPGYLHDTSELLDNMLSIVVGMEFIRTLLVPTPANVVEMLIIAISRHVVLNHSDPLTDIICVLCIIGLIATRRFLIDRKMKNEEQKTDSLVP